MVIRVSVVGAKGRMGQYVCQAVTNDPQTQLVHALDAGDDLRVIEPSNTDVVVEFTSPNATRDNVLKLIDQGVHVVVGTTGWDDADYELLRERMQDKRNQAVFIAPNFAISAVLVDHFARLAAPFFESAEIIELHHPDKLDAPSGTAIRTAYNIAQARSEAGLVEMPDATQGAAPARGERVYDVPVHAVRLRGLNAHEEVLFGNAGEQLVLRADSFDRSSFMPGVLLAVKAMASNRYEHVIIGLAELLPLTTS